MVGLDDVLDALRADCREGERPVSTAPRVADRLAQSRRKTLNDLRYLEKQGEVGSWKAGGNTVVWWIGGEHAGFDTAHDGLSNTDLPDETIRDVLDGWEPGRLPAERELIRGEGARALAWLREQDRPASAGDYRDAVFEPDRVEVSEATWWENYARPALKRAVDAGVVEYRAGHHDYRWIDDG